MIYVVIVCNKLCGYQPNLLPQDRLQVRACAFSVDTASAWVVKVCHTEVPSLLVAVPAVLPAGVAIPYCWTWMNKQRCSLQQLNDIVPYHIFAS